MIGFMAHAARTRVLNARPGNRVQPFRAACYEANDGIWARPEQGPAAGRQGPHLAGDLAVVGAHQVQRCAVEGLRPPPSRNSASGASAPGDKPVFVTE